MFKALEKVMAGTLIAANATISDWYRKNKDSDIVQKK
jgi:hypothetical protein